MGCATNSNLKKTFMRHLFLELQFFVRLLVSSRACLLSIAEPRLNRIESWDCLKFGQDYGVEVLSWRIEP